MCIRDRSRTNCHIFSRHHRRLVITVRMRSVPIGIAVRSCPAVQYKYKIKPGRGRRPWDVRARHYSRTALQLYTSVRSKVAHENRRAHRPRSEIAAASILAD
eukprot:4301617-Prymnesium_polylepis.1